MGIEMRLESKEVLGIAIVLSLLFIPQSLIFSSPLPFNFADTEKDNIESILTARAQTKYACIYGYRGIEIPPFLVSNFDKVYERIASFFKVKTAKNKVIVWVVDYDTLQKMYTPASPSIVAAFYDTRFNCIFFTPKYMNEYYIAHEVVNYFMDEYQERATTWLAQLILEQEKDKLTAE